MRVRKKSASDLCFRNGLLVSSFRAKNQRNSSSKFNQKDAEKMSKSHQFSKYDFHCVFRFLSSKLMSVFELNFEDEGAT